MQFPSIAQLFSALSLLLCFTTTTIINANATDRLALLAIKSQLHDPLEVTSSWNNSVNLCEWTGVTCGHRHQRVTKLDLRNQSIGGLLSPYVGNLSFLRFINIADNGFPGEIPNDIGNLFKLEKLILANNSFSGTIPINLSLCSKLMLFFAHKNNLVGEIPAEIGYLFKLERLSLSVNNLTGQLPASIGNLSSLLEADLSGKIPESLGQLRSLFHLNIGGNQFSGMFPPVYNLSSLEMIYLQDNRFNGNLPLDIGAKLPNLRKIVIALNNFTGPLPDSFSNASNLERLDLSSNQFRGKVAINFNSLKHLSRLHLGKNNLGNGVASDLDFITLLTNCSRLEWLGFYDNQFGGVLPHSIANLSTTMTKIIMGGNKISGTIPAGISNLVNLDLLAMELNQLSGTIPHVIGELRNLQLLYLHSNFLQGSISSSLGNLTRLTYLVLESNNLEGKSPSPLAIARI